MLLHVNVNELEVYDLGVVAWSELQWNANGRTNAQITEEHRVGSETEVDRRRDTSYYLAEQIDN
jgi:hypothetical protein